MNSMAIHDALEDIELQPLCTRKLHATRQRVDQMLAEGWTVASRSPLILERAGARREVRASGIIVDA